MREFDRKKLEIALVYLQRIADGKNPVTNHPAMSSDVLNNPNVCRCMEFVQEILEAVKDNHYMVGSRTKRSDDYLKEPFPLESLSGYVYREDCSITRIVSQINEAVDTEKYRKMSYMPITQWLKRYEYLSEELSFSKGKKKTVCTEKGREIGIYSEETISRQGAQYLAILYNEQAQRFIIDHIPEMMKVYEEEQDENRRTEGEEK